MEAELFNPAKQDEKVLDDPKVVDPDVSTETKIPSTEGLFDDVTTHENTLKPNESNEPATLRKEHADLKHRWNRFKGSTDRTLFDLRSEVTSLNQTVVGLNKKIKELEASSVSDAPAVSQDVRDVLGDETADLVGGLKEEIASLKGQLTEGKADRFAEAAANHQATNESNFRDMLEELVPDLSVMNKSPEFNEWLRQPGSDGVERIAVLRSDQARFDYTRVAGFFNEYKSVMKTKESKRVKDTVDAHRGPTGPKSSSSNEIKDDAAKDTMLMSEINKFNKDVSKGIYKYDSVKADAMETKIFNAYQDNKIIFDVDPI